MSDINKITGADAILLSLIEEGVDTIFGYPGGQIIPFFDRLYDYSDRLNHILTRHEQGAVHAAQGYARVTGKTGVCVVTSGPGATNLLTGIADAMLDSTPLVCFTGQVPLSMLGTDAFQEADIISMTIPVTKWNYQISSASEVASAVAKAFYIANSGRPGPVVLDIPKNVQIELTEFKYAKCTNLRSYNPHPKLSKTAVDKAVEMINASERPLILVGQGVKLAGAEVAMLDFAQAAHLPIATTLMGISAVPNDHPLFVGLLGMHGNIAANRMTQQSDLIIAVGMRFSDRVTGDVKQYAPGAKIIHIDIDQAELGKNMRVDLPVCADAKDALEAFHSQVKYKDRDWWFGFAAQNSELEMEKVILPACGTKDLITMPDVIKALAEIENNDAIIVTDVGQNQMFSAQYSRFKSTRSFITSGGLGTMGFGLPAAIGAKLGAPEREVVAILGDGGFQMSIQELGTIMQNNIGVKILILNNSYLGMVRQWQELFFDKRYSFTTLENPDFAAIATAYRIPSQRVVDPCQLQEALKQMADAKGAYLLEVVVKSDDNVFPMVPSGASLFDLMFNDNKKEEYNE